MLFNLYPSRFEGVPQNLGRTSTRRTSRLSRRLGEHRGLGDMTTMSFVRTQRLGNVTPATYARAAINAAEARESWVDPVQNSV